MIVHVSREPWQRAVIVAMLLSMTSVVPAQALETAVGTVDSDGDGLTDREELSVTGTDPDDPDSDADGLSDGFEVRWNVTDPQRRDSDADGVRDSAEDEDGDRLSNLGEQRFGTDPADRDSDDDGIKDGGEDSNRNRVRDALEQDAREVPPKLRPALADALRDRPVSYAEGCHSGLGGRAILPCTYGDPKGKMRIALFGDSHALQWLPALHRAGKTRGWRVTTLTKSICPSVAVPFFEPVDRGASTSCRRWRNNALRWLHEEPHDIVLMTNSGRYPVIDGDGRRLRADAKERRWQAGLAKVIRSMPEMTQVVVLADTPHLKRNPQICLQGAGKRISDCQTRRAKTLLERHDIAERETAESLGAAFIDLNHAVCSYDPCPVVVDDIMMWRDRGHITATYAQQLAPAMRSAIEDVLAGAPEPETEPAPES